MVFFFRGWTGGRGEDLKKNIEGTNKGTYHCWKSVAHHIEHPLFLSQSFFPLLSARIAEFIQNFSSVVFEIVTQKFVCEFRPCSII